MQTNHHQPQPPLNRITRARSWLKACFNTSSSLSACLVSHGDTTANSFHRPSTSQAQESPLPSLSVFPGAPALTHACNTTHTPTHLHTHTHSFAHTHTLIRTLFRHAPPPLFSFRLIAPSRSRLAGLLAPVANVQKTPHQVASEKTAIKEPVIPSACRVRDQ